MYLLFVQGHFFVCRLFVAVVVYLLRVIVFCLYGGGSHQAEITQCLALVLYKFDLH